MPAIIRTETGRLVTIVRDDTPPGWTPPEGCHAIDAADLPADIEREEAHQEESAEDRIARIQSETDTLYSELPIELQAAFAPIYVAAKDFIMRDKTDVAAALIEAQAVPAELEPLKTAIIERLRS